MKLTLPWLKEHLETDARVDEIAERLTSLGLEVEEVIDSGTALDAFSVALVREAQQHPNADRLRVCEVETNDGVFQVVCGAPNARTGMKGIFAPPGATIPATGDVLKPAKIRGVESQGMLCSARELLVGDDHDGIIEVPSQLQIGTSATKALGVESPLIDLSITPDRADCFGVHGVARDLAASGLGSLKSRDLSPVPSIGSKGPNIGLSFPEGQEDACPLFVGRIIRNVSNGPSPDWLQRRLKSVGLRPISALVDITNLCTLDLGRPLHVFDADKLKGDIDLRFARTGETIEALDGKTYRLDPEMTVIADASGAISLGGIMGGEGTGCTETTRNVLLEVALFDPLRTAATGRKLGIESDARTRFERGLDPAFVIPGTEYATRLIIDLCGGEPGEPVIAGTVPDHRERIDFSPSELPRLTGIDLDHQTILDYLAALGFEIETTGDTIILTTPTWRHDVSTSACIVEELARLHGYDRIPPVAVVRTEAVGSTVLTGEQRRREQIRRTVADRGYFEAVTWSFTRPEWAIEFGGDDLTLVQNPINAEQSAMRPSNLANLLSAAAANSANRETDGALFELGPRFIGSMPGDQKMALAGIRFNAAESRHWSRPARTVDVFDAKADALAALAAGGAPIDKIQVTQGAAPWYHPGRSGELKLGQMTLARFGEIHPTILETFDLETKVVAFEMDLEDLPRTRDKAGRGRPPIEHWPYPPSDRDFAFVVDDGVAVSDLVKAVRSADKKLIRDIEIFDVYTGKGIEAGKKSIALSVRLQSKDRTLTDEEIELVAQRIVEASGKSVQAALRG
ncbi:MAG: phenylalanine--tRNA ligase subunit beta [Pseudomonadota bacterium]